MPSNLWELIQQGNDQKVKLMVENTDVAAFVDALMDYLVQFANHKKVPYKALCLTAPFIGDDEYIRARITIDPKKAS